MAMVEEMVDNRLGVLYYWRYSQAASELSGAGLEEPSSRFSDLCHTCTHHAC